MSCRPSRSVIVPLFPLPETSASTVPVPALKLYAATNPGGGVTTLLTEKLIGKSLVFGLPATSWQRT